MAILGLGIALAFGVVGCDDGADDGTVTSALKGEGAEPTGDAAEAPEGEEMPPHPEGFPCFGELKDCLLDTDDPADCVEIVEACAPPEGEGPPEGDKGDKGGKGDCDKGGGEHDGPPEEFDGAAPSCQGDLDGCLAAGAPIEMCVGQLRACLTGDSH